MIYKIRIISDEIDGFLREIQISAEATFFDLHKIILDSCGYSDDQITSFIICNDEWERQTEITREDMGTGSVDEDIYVMESTRLNEFLEDEKQRLIYIFDPFSDRAFYMELSEIILGKDLKNPICSISRGEPPMQIEEIDFSVSKTGKNGTEVEELGDDFYGSDDFESDEFDPEGFEISDGDPYKD